MSVPSLVALCLAGFWTALVPASSDGPKSGPTPQVQQKAPSQSAQQDKQDKPDEVLARAKQIYNEDGPRPALPVFERALALYQGAGDRRGEAITMGLIGNCYKKFGEHQKALDLLNRALAMKRELGDRLEEGKTLSHLGLVYWEMGQFPAAIDNLTRSISVGRELGDKQLEGSALNNLSLVYDENARRNATTSRRSRSASG